MGSDPAPRLGASTETGTSGPAAVRWRELLAARAVPAEIRNAAPRDPYRHDPGWFAAPERPADTPSRRAGLELLGDGGTVLDVGCGAGAASLALSERVRFATGVDTAADMLTAFAAGYRARGIPHRTVHGPWPEVAPEAGHADVVVCHHVGYNAAELAPFLAALGAAVRRGLVIELTAVHPTAWLDPLWERFHGMRRPAPATAWDALAVLHEIGMRPRVQQWRRPPRHTDPVAEAEIACRRLCLPPRRRDEVAAAIAELPERPREVVTLTWRPAEEIPPANGQVPAAHA